MNCRIWTWPANSAAPAVVLFTLSAGCARVASIPAPAPPPTDTEVMAVLERIMTPVYQGRGLSVVSFRIDSIVHGVPRQEPRVSGRPSTTYPVDVDYHLMVRHSQGTDMMDPHGQRGMERLCFYRDPAEAWTFTQCADSAPIEAKP